MGIPTFRSKAFDDNGAGNSTTIVGGLRPAGVVDGDFLIASVAVIGGAPVTVTPPLGWTLLRRIDSGSTISLAVYYRFAQGEAPRWTFAFSATGVHTVSMRAYRGVDTFNPVDADGGQANESSVALPAAALTSSVANTLLVANYLQNATATLTAPTGYADRGSNGNGTSTQDACDKIVTATGTVGGDSASSSGAAISLSHALVMRPSISTVTVEQVRAALKAAFPPGDDDLYNWDDSATPDDLYLLTLALAEFFKAYGYDYVDLVRQESNPLTMVSRIPDWEQALAITQNTASATNNSTLSRRNAIISKLRESGGATIYNIVAALEPLLGYTGANAGTLQIVECNRAALTALHTYTNATGASIGGNSSTTQTVYVYADSGAISVSGVQVIVRITSTNPEQLSFVLTGPNGSNGQASVTWAAASLPAGSVTSADCYLYEKASSAGTSIEGPWTLKISTGAAACTLVQWQLFVEGIAANQSTGGAAYEWGAYADPAKVTNPDYAAARNSIARQQLGWTLGRLLLSINPYPDVSSGANAAIPDACIPV